MTTRDAASRTATRELDRLRGLAAELSARDEWTRERLLAHRRGALRQLVSRAVEASPYYREALGPDAPDRPIADLPTLSKETLVEQWDRIVSDPRLRSREVEAHATGPDAAEPYLGEFRVAMTSGTTGLLGTFIYGPDDWPIWVAANLRQLARLGIGPETRLVAIGAPGAMHVTRQLFAIFQAGRAGAPRLSVLTPLAEIVEALNAYRPEALVSYPTIAGLLADEQLAGRLEIAPQVYACGAEPLAEHVVSRVVAAWGVRPANVYATTEAPMVAASDARHPGLDIAEDPLVVEVVDERDRPVAPGTPGTKLLVTNLANRIQPLIRYELTDRVTVASHGNPSGRPYAQLSAIEGRTADTIVLRGHDGGRVEVLPYRLGTPFVDLPEVRQFQVVWNGKRLEVRVVLRPDAPADTQGRVRAAVTEALEAAGVAPPSITVSRVAELEREPGHAAKVKLIKSTASTPSADEPLRAR
jgi:phenylacetate-coenzyme A ligase PaaK-like adenylate-forming protein